jgi:heme exporter protein D
MPDELTIALLVTILALIIDLERRVARLETLINDHLRDRKREGK